MIRRTVHALAAALLLWAGTAASAAAQQSETPRRPTRVPVTLALVDSVPQGNPPFRILRRADVEPHDVILLRADADSVTLSAAVADLLLIRAQQGDTTRAEAMVRVRRRDAEPDRPVRMLPWGRRVMDDLRRAAPKELAGVGTVPAVQIWLPPQRRRTATAAP